MDPLEPTAEVLVDAEEAGEALADGLGQWGDDVAEESTDSGPWPPAPAARPPGA